MATVNIFDMADTWNNVATTYTAIKMNVTDTASNASSLLMDLQVGGSSKLSITKAGRIQGDSTAPHIILSNAVGAELSYSTCRIINGGSGITLYSSGSPRVAINLSGNFVTQPSGQYSFAASVNTTSPADAIITRRAAANLRFGAADAAAPVAQTLSVQSVVAGTSNTAGANFTITGSQGTGTGAGGSIIFQVAPAGGSETAQNSLVTFLEATSARAFNLYNTADVTTNYERGKIAWESNVLRIGTEKAGTGTARALEFQTDGTTRLTIADTGAATFSGSITGTSLTLGTGGVIRVGSINNGNNTRTFWTLDTSNDVATFANGQTSPIMRFSGATSSFPALKRSSTTLQVRLADDSAFAPLESASVKTDAPAGGTSGTWKLGVAATVSPTSPNRTIEVDIGGTIYYIHAKTTND